MDLIFSHLNPIQLVALTRVCSSWRRLAIYRLSCFSSLDYDVIKTKKRDIRQEGLEWLVKYCGGGVRRIVLRVTFPRKVYCDFARMMRVIAEYSTGLEELVLWFPQCLVVREEIRCSPSLKTLEIKGNILEEQLASIVEHSPHIEHLVLESNLFLTGDFITTHLQNATLQTVTFRRCTHLTSETVSYILRNYQSTLSSVSISDFPMENIFAFEKSNIPCYSSMRKLELGSWYAKGTFRSQGFSSILENMPNLRELSMRHSLNLTDGPEELETLVNLCPRLDTLDLSGTVITSASFLQPLTRLDNLRKLVLQRFDIQKEPFFDFEHLVNSILAKIPSIEQLYLEDPTSLCLRDDHVFSLLALPSLKHLTIFKGCGIDGRFIEQVLRDGSRETREEGRFMRKEGSSTQTDIQIVITTNKSCENGQELWNKIDCAPEFMKVFVLWDD